ncbi:MAG TPA: gliding motility protein RemB [Flavobacterium sp.]|jgi:hypothetical protein
MAKKYILSLLFFGAVITAAAQASTAQEQFPVFPGCEGKSNGELETCFYGKVQDFVYGNFAIPPGQTEAKGTIIVLFEVDDSGAFKAQYVDAPTPELAAESRRVFAMLPKVGPPLFNGNPTYARYTIRIPLPLQKPGEVQRQLVSEKSPAAAPSYYKNNKELAEYDSIVSKRFDNPQLESNLNIPFSHSYYAWFEAEVNQIGANNHTASKPLTYAEVGKYYDFKANYEKIRKNKEGWYGRKLWNENTVQFQGEGYWFTLNPILDLQVGKNTPGEVKYTYVNTRGLQFQGGLGQEINFTTSIYESQGRFADYYNQYAESIAPSGGGPAIIPGVGIAKRFKEDSYDFPLAEATLSYTPSRIFNMQLGYGRNFIGDGYRSLLESDAASPYPYFKLNTRFWKIKYTNTYMWLKDVRPGVTEDRTYETKYMANHYLSLNVSKRLNIGLFESVVWANTNGRGFDANFINPIIFYRTVEFSSSARSGNALLGLTAKYKVNNRVSAYGQFLLDEFSLVDMKGGEGSWKNKFGYQVGVKYFNAFGIQNLLLQAEYNHVRPYVYAHSDPLTNYAHNNQSMGHQWGGNFQEVIGIARFHAGRIFADGKITYGVRGLDFDTPENSANYGGNIFKDYEENRPFDTGVKVGQGNKTTVFIADIRAGYLVNPSTNLKFFASVIYRNFDPMQETLTAFKDNTTWFSIGLRSDLFNWYFDY